MAQFNFTVRATDSEGSFADRNFSINVRNTKIDRFLAVNTTDAYSSIDGNTWTLRAGAGGYITAFNNLTWYVLTPTSIKISTDAINFSEILFSDSRIVFKDITTGVVNDTFALKTTAATTYISNFIKHGNYISCVVYVGSARWFMRTLDGMTWEYLSASFIGGSASVSSLKGLIFTYDAPTLFVGAQVTGASTIMGYKSEDNGATWTTMTRSSATFAVGWLGRINGFYMAFTNQLGGLTSMMTSSDGVSWTTNAFTGATGYIATANRVSSVFYLNGRLVAIIEKLTSNTTAGFFTMTSLDGVNWSMIVTGNAYASGTFAYTMGSVMRNGKIVVLPNIASHTGVKWSTDGLSFTSIANATSGLAAIAYSDLASM